MSVLATLFLLQVLSCAYAQLQLYAAGGSTAVIAALQDGYKICPEDFESGFNIRCINRPDDRTAQFSIDGIDLRTERHVPFFVGGDRRGVPRAWKGYPRSGAPFVLRCRTDAGTSHVRVSIACPSGMAGPNEETTTDGEKDTFDYPVDGKNTDGKGVTDDVDDVDDTNDAKDADGEDVADDDSGLFFVSTSPKNNVELPMTNSMTMCPVEDVQSAKFTILCRGGSDASSATFYVNGKRVKMERRVPFLIAGDDASKVYPYTEYPKLPFDVVCNLSNGKRIMVTSVRIACMDSENKIPEPPMSKPEADEPEADEPESDEPESDETEGDEPKQTLPKGDIPEPKAPYMPKPQTPTGEKECIVIDAKKTRLSDGWELTSNGVAYLPKVRERNVSKPGLAPLTYRFRAPSTSRYAIVVDMTTGHKVDHNDIWMDFLPGGLQLSRHGKRKLVNGWTKVYHNKGGRAALSGSVDFRTHSISTGISLREGAEFVIGISGRSSMVTVHRILLFACDEGMCERKYWKTQQEDCAPGSTDH